MNERQEKTIRASGQTLADGFTPEDIRITMIEIAESTIGLGPRSQTELYLELIAPFERLDVQKAMLTKSCCGLVARGWFALLGSEFDAFQQPYRIGRAFADLHRMANAKGMGAARWGSGVPKNGDIVFLGDDQNRSVYGGPGHVCLCVDWTGEEMRSIDGGLDVPIQRRKRRIERRKRGSAAETLWLRDAWTYRQIVAVIRTGKLGPSLTNEWARVYDA